MKYFVMAFTCLSLCIGSIAHAERTIQLTLTNTINFRGQVNQQSILYVIEEIEKLKKLRASPNTPIYIVLDTPGGEVLTGLALVKEIKKTPNVIFIMYHAESMGSFMPQFLDRPRLMVSEGKIFMHQIRSLLPPMTLEQLEMYIAQERNFQFWFYDKVSDRMDTDPQSLVDILRKEQEFNAIEALHMNMIDESVKITCSKMLTSARMTINKVDAVGKVVSSQRFSKCPLIRGQIIE